MESVQDGPRNLRLKFCQNWFSNSRDIADIEFVVVGGVQSHFHVKPNFIKFQLWLSWDFDKKLF